MANKKQLDRLLKEGVSNWNEWRRQNPREYVDLREAFLMEKNLSKIDLIGANLQGAYLRRANLKKAHLNQAHLEGANLWEAHMEEAALIGANLEGADLHKAHLDGAFLYEAHLEGADLRATNLKGAKLCWTHLEGADLREAHLEGADLQWAVLEGRLVPSDDLQRIQDGDKSFPQTLSPADLRSAFFDSATNLRDITLGNRDGFVPLADVHWGGVNLAVINWDSVTILGDEREVHQFRRGGFNERAQLVAFQQAIRANHQLAAVLQDQAMLGEADHFAHRAQVLHRKLLQLQLLLHVASLWEKIQKTLVWESVVEIGQDIMKPWHWLSLQGTRLSKFAVKNIPGPMAVFGSFMFIVLVCFMLVPMVLVGLFMFILLNTPLEKRVLEVGRWIMASGKSALEVGWWKMVWLWHRLFELGTLLYKLGGLIFVLFLGVLAGYGYRPERTFFWYLSVVTGFALAFHALYNVQLSEAFFLSLTSFHGRGFFPGSELANSPVRFPAAIEAVVGLFIEISFIAAFTRRFFGK